MPIVERVGIGLGEPRLHLHLARQLDVTDGERDEVLAGRPRVRRRRRREVLRRPRPELPRRDSSCSAIVGRRAPRARILRGKGHDAARGAAAADELRRVAGKVKIPSATGTCAITCSIRRVPTTGTRPGGRRARASGTRARAVPGTRRHLRGASGAVAASSRSSESMRCASAGVATVIMRHTSWRVSATETGAVPATRSRRVLGRGGHDVVDDVCARPNASASSPERRRPIMSQSSASGMPTRRGQEPRRARFGHDAEPGEHEPEASRSAPRTGRPSGASSRRRRRSRGRSPRRSPASCSRRCAASRRRPDRARCACRPRTSARRSRGRRPREPAPRPGHDDPRTSGSASMRSNTAHSSRCIVFVNTLSRSGRCRVIRTTPPASGPS